MRWKRFRILRQRQGVSLLLLSLRRLIMWVLQILMIMVASLLLLRLHGMCAMDAALGRI